jgi:hypothetical protein
MFRNKISVTVAALLLSAGALVAQTAAPAPTGVEISGSWRSRGESWDWWEASTGNNDYDFLGSLLRLSASQKGAKLDWQFEIAQPSLFNLPDDANAPAPQGALGLGANYYAANGRETAFGLIPKQAFVRFKGIAGAGSSLRVGRFEFIEGMETTPKDPILASVKRDRVAHRLIGNFGWSHVGRSFDGVQFVKDLPKVHLTFTAARPTAGVFDVDDMSSLDIDVLYGAATVPLTNAEWRLFGIGYQDDRNVVKTDNRPLAVRNADREEIGLYTLGSHYLRSFKVGSGSINMLLWGAWQGGDWGMQDHSATAGDLELGWRGASKLQPGVRVGAFRSSGDSNAADDDHETFFQLLPTPRIYARMPFYNAMNSEDLFIEGSVAATSKLSVTAAYHRLGLTDEADLWYSGGGAFEKRSFGYAGRTSRNFDELADLIDVNLSYAVTPTLNVSLYAASASGGEVIDAIYPTDDSAKLVFVEVTKRFTVKKP